MGSPMIFHEYTVKLTYRQASEILDSGFLEGEDQQKFTDELHQHKQEIIDAQDHRQQTQ
jgi:hypothetical protein